MYAVSWSRFEPGNFGTRSRITNALTVGLGTSKQGPKCPQKISKAIYMNEEPG
jgi:hypothetical protein